MLSHSRLPAWLLIPLVGLAWFVRSIGLGFDLPKTHLDGSVVASQTDQIRNRPPAERGGRLWRFYPVLLAYTAAVLPWEDPQAPEEGAHSSWPLEEHMAAAGATWMRVRKTSTLLSLLLIPATFLLARRFLEPWTALLAAAFVATSLLHLEFGTRVRPHGLAASTMACALLLALWLRRRGSLLRYGVAATGAGLAVGSLHYGFFVLPASGLAGLLAREATRARKLLGFALALGIIAGFVVWLYPFHFAGDNNFLSIDGGKLDLSGQPLKFQKIDGTGFERSAIYLWSYEPTLFVLGIAGLVALGVRLLRGERWGKEARLDASVLALCYGAYGLVVGLYAESWERFLIPLLPVFATLAAVPVAGWARRLRSRPAGVVLALLALTFPAYCQVHLVRLRAADSTLDMASDFVAQRLRPGHDRLALLTYSHLNLPYHPDALEENRDERFGSLWQRYQDKLLRRLRDPEGYLVLLPQGPVAAVQQAVQTDVFSYLQSVGADFVLIPVDPDGALSETRHMAREQLRKRLKPVWIGRARSSYEYAALPYSMLRDVDWTHSVVKSILTTDALGFTLELYELPD